MDGKIPDLRENDGDIREPWPRAIIDNEAEGYIPPWGSLRDRTDISIFIRAPRGRDVSGTLYYPNADNEGMSAYRFKIPASLAASDAKRFYHAKAAHYHRLLNEPFPGGAWFRHQWRQARTAGGEHPQTADFQGRRTRGDLDSTYALFSGGRAVSENLQLDRVLPAATQGAQQDQTPVKLDSIKGITVREMDWAPLIKDVTPQLDPLASKIPADQHVVFFPSMKSLAAVVELAEKHGTPALQSLEPQAESAKLRERYEKQLGHSINDLVGLADAGLIQSVAVTGSDPYLRVGTDIAIVMESKQPHELARRLAESKDPQTTRPSYLTALDDAVVLANAARQQHVFGDVSMENVPALSTAPEYIFFRTRYPRGEAEEAGLLILTDATIRRWCGPRWRIADSRRTRAAAVLAELQAQNLDAIAKGNVQPKMLTTTFPLLNPGELQLTATGVRSSTYGNLAFMTPISELDITEVTQAEKQSYERWRDSYQRNWSWAFDPIAFRLSLPRGKIAADLTVMPLIDASRYRPLMETSKGASIKPGTGDPHPQALAHLAYAVNPNSAPMKSMSQRLSMFLPQLKVNPLDWLGQTVAIYCDDDPFWDDLASAKDKEEFMMHNLGRLPVALNAEVRQPLKLAAFLAAVRAFIEQSAPNLTQWHTPQHNGRAYVKITANVGGMFGDDDMPDFNICYATSPTSFTLTLTEDLLKRAIDRQLAREIAASQPAAGVKTGAKAPATQPAQPWLGANLALHVDRQFLTSVPLNPDDASDAQSFMRRRAWGNIPILNEWKRLYPDRDPLDVHEQTWHVRLLDPAGGQYVWNEQYQTMESTTYGHPAAPKKGPATPRTLDIIQRGSFGVDFEDQGIRARAELMLKQ